MSGNNFLTFKLLKQGYRYRNLRKAFSQFYNRHSVQYLFKNSSATSRIRTCIYGVLVYKLFKRIVGKPSLSDQFKKIIKRYKIVGYNMIC